MQGEKKEVFKEEDEDSEVEEDIDMKPKEKKEEEKKAPEKTEEEKKEERFAAEMQGYKDLKTAKWGSRGIPEDITSPV